MNRIALFSVFCLIIFILSGNTMTKDEGSGSLEPSGQVLASAYVQMPNFNVLHESPEPIFTIIKDVPIPSAYEGSLIQLKDDDLSELIYAANNLHIERMIVFSEDKKIGLLLQEQGFLVEFFG